MSDFGDMRHPIGRKDHRCAWCGLTIPKGEKHHHFHGRWNDDWQDWRMHNLCYTTNEYQIAEGFVLFSGEVCSEW